MTNFVFVKKEDLKRDILNPHSLDIKGAEINNFTFEHHLK